MLEAKKQEPELSRVLFEELPPIGQTDVLRAWTGRAVEIVHATLELRPEDVAANDAPPVDSSIPEMRLGAEQLEVYGWESSFWRKIKGYLGF